MTHHDFPDLPWRAFRKRTDGTMTLEGGKGDAPPPPDYTAAAQATAAGNEAAARAAAAANRVNQIGPGGSITYSRQPGTFDQAGYDAALAAARASGGKAPDISLYGNPDAYQVQTTLSPAQQQIYDLQAKTNIGLGQLAQTGLEKASGLLSNPELDLSGVPKRAIAPGQTAQDAILARLNPQINQSRAALNTQLANQGIPIGSEAYNNAMRTQGEQENDLRSQAALQGINLDQQGRAQGIQEQAFLQDRPLNLINALRSGTQVQGPTFNNVPQQATTSGPNYAQAADSLYGAKLGAYNAGVAQNNATTGGLFNLAAAGVSAYGGK